MQYRLIKLKYYYYIYKYYRMKYITYFEYIDKNIKKVNIKNKIYKSDRKSYTSKRKKNYKIIYNNESNYDNYVRGCC